MVPLKHLSNCWRTLEMALINCEVNLTLTWSANCFTINTDVANQNPTFEMTETKLMFQQLLYQLTVMQNYYHN